MSYNIQWEDRGIKVIASGVFGDGFLNVNKNFTSDPRFVDAQYAIVEFKNVDKFPIDAATLKQIALSDAQVYEINPQLKVAVISNGQVINSLAHMYHVFFELSNNGKAWEMEIFESEKQARDWIREVID